MASWIQEQRYRAHVRRLRALGDGRNLDMLEAIQADTLERLMNCDPAERNRRLTLAVTAAESGDREAWEVLTEFARLNPQPPVNATERSWPAEYRRWCYRRAGGASDRPRGHKGIRNRQIREAVSARMRAFNESREAAVAGLASDLGWLDGDGLPKPLISEALKPRAPVS